MDERDRQCLEDLRVTDPRDDKKRIEETKGGLFQGSYLWILENVEFRRWCDNQQSRLLWIKGDPGKGKTMLLCGIIDELKKSTVETGLLSFFFCQGTDSRINNAMAVLRGLIYLIIVQQPSLISHIRKKYDHAGKELLNDVNAWAALSEIFENILHDPSLKVTYLIIDALDECEKDLPKLLGSIVQHSAASPNIKWIVSSRNRIDIEQKLQLYNSRMMDLKENAEQISGAVDAYIDYYVPKLAALQFDKSLQDQVRDIIRQKANGTFLWVSLVIKELKEVETWEILKVINEMPMDLKEVYRRMTEQIQRLKRGNSEHCRSVLSIVTTAYRPLHLAELGVLSGLPREILSISGSVAKIVNMCGSFLTIQDDNVNIIHQSAKDFLVTDAYHNIFFCEVGDVHYTIFLRSLEIMYRTLRRDMYGLRAPGFPIGKIKQPDPDPLALADYSCVHWIDHLCDWNSTKSAKHRDDINDEGVVDKFLRQKYLYWLEALSLLRSVSEGILSMDKLEDLLQVSLKSILLSRKHPNITLGKGRGIRIDRSSPRCSPIYSIS
jgi:NACHT domain